MDPELTQIINSAFIYESCSQRRSHAEYRKQKLTEKLNSYIEKKLSESTRSGSDENKISARLGTSGIRPLNL
jgi:hypothetical protein